MSIFAPWLLPLLLTLNYFALALRTCVETSIHHGFLRGLRHASPAPNSGPRPLKLNPEAFYETKFPAASEPKPKTRPKPTATVVGIGIVHIVSTEPLV